MCPGIKLIQGMGPGVAFHSKLKFKLESWCIWPTILTLPTGPNS